MLFTYRTLFVLPTRPGGMVGYPPPPTLPPSPVSLLDLLFRSPLSARFNTLCSKDEKQAALLEGVSTSETGGQEASGVPRTGMLIEKGLSGREAYPPVYEPL